MAIVAAVSLLAAACSSSGTGGGGGGTTNTSGASTGGVSSGSVSSVAPPAGATAITLAGLMDDSGQLASFGQEAAQGLKLGVDQINGAGGFTVGGKKYTFKLDIQDGRSDPTASVAAVRNFLSSGDKFLFGPDTDATSLQVLGVTNNTNVLNFIGGAVDQSVIGNAGHRNTFGVITPNPDWEGSVLPLLQTLGVPKGKVAILYPDDTAGQGVGPQFTKILATKGYSAQAFLFPPTTTDFRTIVARAKAVHPVAILEGYSAQWGLPITQAAVQLQAAPAVIGVDQDATSVPLVIAKSLGKNFPLKWGSMAADQQAADPTTPGMKGMQAAWVKYFHQQPTASVSDIAIWFYNAVLNLVDGMQKAGSVSDTTAIANSIRSNTFDGPETVKWTANNLPVHGTDYSYLQGSKIVYKYSPPPAS